MKVIRLQQNDKQNYGRMKGVDDKMSKKILVTICSTVAVAAVAVVGVLAFGGKDKQEPESSVADVLEPVTEAPTEPTLPEIDEFSDPKKGLLGRAELLLEENEDTVGYIKIDDTNVDYPVVQCKEDNEYYLHRGFDQEYNFAGVIYMDYRDIFTANEKEQSENIVLYGHNMKNGSMFANLHKYRTDETFYDLHPIIEFSSNYEDYKYVIFSYFTTYGDYGSSAYGDEFAYWDMEELDTKEAFDDYVDVCNERSISSTGVDVEYGDKLLTLQTCHLDSDNSRMLVIARRLRPHETIDNIDKSSVAVETTEDAEEALEE